MYESSAVLCLQGNSSSWTFQLFTEVIFLAAILFSRLVGRLKLCLHFSWWKLQKFPKFCDSFYPIPFLCPHMYTNTISCVIFLVFPWFSVKHWCLRRGRGSVTLYYETNYYDIPPFLSRLLDIWKQQSSSLKMRSLSLLFYTFPLKMSVFYL